MGPRFLTVLCPRKESVTQNASGMSEENDLFKVMVSRIQSLESHERLVTQCLSVYVQICMLGGDCNQIHV